MGGVPRVFGSEEVLLLTFLEGKRGLFFFGKGVPFLHRRGKRGKSFILIIGKKQ